MIDYGQFCTVARGAEVLGALWMPLVVRELLRLIRDVGALQWTRNDATTRARADTWHPMPIHNDMRSRYRELVF
jgi:hypothetical protein